ncbi:hypothetical protein LOTGIDRAFT_131547 [Lottia gigantea]|uniref:Photolyase/cryptochrome alpha/beta domain-containing protein n=1 Tax=Lottia gigantea TaxID=225164 RepID=V3ZV38_LOTGI|nr:hypothetical protein LOTGIDRAFT_131547 [Lottia gigantea]ESO84816.1 hypothetical protein LOTGIDRAFT_131547 [Lottia gigantea]
MNEQDNVPAKHSIHWFRRGLRLHDNPALIEAVKGATTFRCVYILDPWFASSSNIGVNKWRFLLECLEDLDSSLRKLNSRLYVVLGQPVAVFPSLFKKWKITALTFEEETEPHGRNRDNVITSLAHDAGVEVIKKTSHTLYNLQDIIQINSGKPPLTFLRFQSLLCVMGPPNGTVNKLTEKLINNCENTVQSDHDEKYGVPDLATLGFDCANLNKIAFKGGETEALCRLHRHLERKAWIASFETPKMTPESLMPSQTTLSPYLRFGCLSAREFYWQLRDLFKKLNRGEEPSLAMYGQLLWREFFYLVARDNMKFDQMQGNPICVQIPWDKNSTALAKWTAGMTGYPWIDAIMTQLKKDGWIHHLARHAVACFLTRGDLWLSWEEGMKIFDEYLLDADWSINAGMWMWLSCSSFFAQFFHCYCPVNFGKRVDPSGDFIRHYLPILRAYPQEYIFEPWTAPESVQKSAKCIIGKDYPLPMVNHHEVSQLNADRLRQVYHHLTLKVSSKFKKTDRY